jgi:hypothetical protein
MHQDYNQENADTLKWDWWSSAFNCRISISASPHLNGKLVVEIEKIDALGWVYLQPNYFNNEKGTHGILENG